MLLGIVIVWNSPRKIDIWRIRCLKNGYVKFFLLDAEPCWRSQQFPGERNRILLEIISKRKIAQHLEKRVMPLRKPHIFQIVVLAARAHALLAARRPRVIPFLQSKEHILELVHPRIREQQRRVPMWHQRRAPHPPVPLALKEAQEPFTDLVPAPKFLAYRFTRHVRLSFAGFNPQIIADAAHPRNEPRVGSSATYCELGLLYGGRFGRTMLPISSTHSCDRR